jgi:hypothetical protein
METGRKEGRPFVWGRVYLSISRMVGFFLLTPNVTLSRLLYISVTTNVILLAFCYSSIRSYLSCDIVIL